MNRGCVMNKLALIILTVEIVLCGCNKPAPVELQSDTLLEMSSVAQVDSNLGLATVDSSAILPEDQWKFPGLVQIAHLTFDGGQRVIDTAFAHVLFENRARPIQVGTRLIGYHGTDLGQVTLNGAIMFRILHRLGRRDTAAGFEYYRDMTALYQPRAL